MLLHQESNVEYENAVLAISIMTFFGFIIGCLFSSMVISLQFIKGFAKRTVDCDVAKYWTDKDGKIFLVRYDQNLNEEPLFKTEII